MNNIGYLRKRLDLTYRSLEKECGIDRSTLNLLEKGKQKLTEARIDTLCSFFKVSSDFLLGKSDYGIIVEIKSGFTSISKEDYERYLSQGLLKEYVQYKGVWRIPNDELEEQLDPNINKDVREEIENEMKNMSRKELEKVLKFIKEFVK